MKNVIINSKLLLALAFFLSIFNIPYGYYELIRVIGFILFLMYALDNYRIKNEIWVFFWLGSALLINPIFKFIFDKDLWNVLDIIWGVILIYRYQKA